jgi:hypothetical protein
MSLEKTIFLYDKIYIPKGLVPDTQLLKSWEIIHVGAVLTGEKKCEQNPKNLPNHRCIKCPGYKGTKKLWGEYRGKNNINYYFVPLGAIGDVFTRLNIPKETLSIVDKRCKTPFSTPLVFTGKLRTGEIENGIPTPNQKYIVDKWLEKGYGSIQAAPRTGKSVIGTAISCKLGVRTLIITHQEELLNNFYKAFENMTNLQSLREQTGKEIVKIIDSVEEITDDLDVVLITYQKFIRKETSEERIDKFLKDKFGFFVIDECHSSGSPMFSKFLYKLSSKYRLGLSATPNRKDCVAAETKIWTERGVLTTKEIYALAEKGDRVKIYSLNNETKQVELKPVLEYHKVEVNEYKKITLQNGDMLEVTLDHEFL